MDANARYLFDLQGYCVIPNAMTKEQLAKANAAIDANMYTIRRRGEQGRGDLSGNSPALKRDQGRGDIGGAMTWPGTHGEIFRELLAHPTSTAALLEVFDDGFRLDHMYGILMTAGTEGHTMHGGGHIERPGAFYRYRDGKMRCGLTVASWQLTDQMEGDGGFAVVPGSECAAPA